MKKLLAFVFSVCMLLSLCACSRGTGAYTVEKEGKIFEVDPVGGTIFDGTYTYQYAFFGDASSYSIDITYPDGSTYFWEQTGSAGHGGSSEDYDETRYTAGETLCDIVEGTAPAPTATNLWKVAIPILLIILGGLNVIVPQVAWKLEYGWRYKNAEPSDAALHFNRIGGIIVVVLGVVLLIV